MRSTLSLSLILGTTSVLGYVLPIRSAQWPKPNTGYVEPDPEQFLCVSQPEKFEFVLDIGSSPKSCGVLDAALGDLNTRYAIPGECESTESLSKTINVAYTKCEDFITPDVDESYKLTVTDKGEITITAPNQFGIRHGMTTLGNFFEANLVGFDSDKMDAEYKYFVQEGTPAHIFVFPYPKGVTVEDKPRLPHRGLQIDTARTFIPLESIRETVKAMGMVKMNVLHWHLTDDQSFPALLESNPTLMKHIHGKDCSEKTPEFCRGLFAPDSYYTDAFIKEIVDLAENNGVRVIFEIDQPAHAASWVFANRDLLFYRGQNTREAFYETWGVLDLLNKGDEIWTDYGVPIMNHFMKLARPGEYIHFGADEFPTGVFGPGKDEVELVEPWLEKCITLIEDDKRKSIAWQDGLKSEAGKKHASVAAHIWDDATKAIEIANSGHDIIWSPATVMYVDCGRGNTVIPDLGSWCQPYSTWYEIYLQTPDILIEGDKDYVGGDKAGKVLGGETALWNDARNREEQETGLWPRAAAWAGASWEARTKIPISAMVATTTTELNEGIKHAVEAQQQLGHVTRRIQTYTNLQVASFFQDYCLYKGSALCDSYIGVWYTENFEKNQADKKAADSTD